MRHSTLFNSNLKGTISNAIGAFVDMEYFNVGNYGLTGSLPASMSAWKKVTEFDVVGSKFDGALPVLDYGAMKRCVLIGAPFAHKYFGNYFSCPFPPGVTKKCQLLHSMNYEPITNANCHNTTASE